jgi:hypothetical protein
MITSHPEYPHKKFLNELIRQIDNRVHSVTEVAITKFPTAQWPSSWEITIGTELYARNYGFDFWDEAKVKVSTPRQYFEMEAKQENSVENLAAVIVDCHINNR